LTDLLIRDAGEHDAEALLALINAHMSEGHLLPRDLAELRLHAGRFIVAELGGELVACAELAPLSARVAEVRSLVVGQNVRRVGLASRMVGELRSRARAKGFATLCAFTHDARFFIRQNFSIVPHTWLPEKISTDCLGCPLFRKCAQHAMVLSLTDIRRDVGPSAPPPPAQIAAAS
jgi:N-acetylglutamate synthase-like GNAT family acetyltransferase